MHSPRSLIIALAAASMLFTACDSNVRGTFTSYALTAPTFGVPTVQFAPQTLALLPVGGFGCPLVPPFRTNFTLVVDGRGSADMFLHQVGFRFLDGSGTGRTPLIVTPSELLSQFGQTLILGGTSRSFAFAPQFGCDLMRPRTLAADIVLLDRIGSWHQLTLSVPMM